jgi:hypothetical protein
MGILAGVATAQAQTNPSATLLFKSGFEGNIVLSHVSGNLSTYQAIQGADSQTNFSWPLELFSPNPQLTGLQEVISYGTPASEDINNYIQNSIETVTGHSGSTTHALLLKALKASNATCCLQDNLQSASLANPPNDMYERFWVKYNPELLSQVQANKNQFYRTVWTMKTTNDYRIEAYIYGDTNGNPYWYAHGDNNPAGPPLVEYWSASNKSVPVPLNQWALVEIYLHRSTGSDGRFFWAVNGQTVVDHQGPNYGANNAPINVFMYSSVYTQYYPAYQWIDDLEIWSEAPCANLPCGASSPSAGTSSTSDTTAPSVAISDPANGATVSGTVHVSANASDNVGVAKVQFYVDSALAATYTTSPYAVELDTTKLTNGSHTIQAKAWDADGNSSTDTISVTVNNVATSSAPQVVSVAPSRGRGSRATFTFAYADGNGGANIANTHVLFNNVLYGPSGCWIYYQASNNTLQLANTSSSWQSGAIGSSTVLQNAQCSISLAGASASISGQNLSLRIPITFKSAFAGTKNIYLRAQDKTGQIAPYQVMGTWKVTR